MKKLLSLFLCASFAANAQRVKADTITTNKGPLVIQPVFHAAFVLTWNDKTIYIDPYGGTKAYEGLKAPDIILITDIHKDHLDVETLNAIETSKAFFVVPYAVDDELLIKYKKNITVIGNGKETVVRGITIKTIPMYNLPQTADAMHPKGRGNGYILEVGGKRIYISGDTEDIPEMRKLKDIDVAFVCMNLPYTMDVNQAASAVLEFKPKAVYPYHYRGKDGFSDTETFKKLVNAGDKKIDVRNRNWYPEY
jgi:L-ascorbate metabolism protein UlaG (beta-lactamase superfamily)